MLPRNRRPAQPKRKMYVAFVAAGENLVVPAASVAAVGALGAVTALPTADPRRLGLTVHQGRLITLLDPAASRLWEVGLEAFTHLVVLREGGGEIALAVERLIGLKVAYGDEIPEGCSLLATEKLMAGPEPGAHESEPEVVSGWRR